MGTTAIAAQILHAISPTPTPRPRGPGWDVSRDIIAWIELSIRWVADLELILLARVLDMPVNQLLPRRVARDEILRARAE